MGISQEFIDVMVENDVLALREQYFVAGKGEPTDEEIVWFFGARCSDGGEFEGGDGKVDW